MTFWMQNNTIRECLKTPCTRAVVWLSFRNTVKLQVETEMVTNAGREIRSLTIKKCLTVLLDG